MAGSQQYKNLEIHYVLKAIHLRMPSDWVRMRFEQRFKRKLTENQLRYLKNKYGRDPRFGTPVANSTSPFGTPNPRVGPNYWPTDDILGIDYRSFEERGDDVAEPNLRIVAPINGLVPPTPTPVGSYSPASPMARPRLDGFELAGALSAHTTSVTGQKRSHDVDDENQVRGSQASPVQNLPKISRVQAPAGYENSLFHQSSSPIAHGNGPVPNSVDAFGAVGPVPPAPVPIARPPPFRQTGPVQNFNFAFGQADQMQPFLHANVNNMGQTSSSNMYAGGTGFEQTPQAGISGFNYQGNNTGMLPYLQPNTNVDFNGLVEQNASKAMNVPNTNFSGTHCGLNGLNQNPSLANPWGIHTGLGMTSMNLLNSTPDFMGLNNTPAVHHGGLGVQGSLGPVSNMAQPVMGYHPSNNPFTQHPVLYGPTAPQFQHHDGTGTNSYFPQFSGVASQDHAEQNNYTEFIGGTDVCSAGTASLDLDAFFHPPAQANAGNHSITFSGVTTSDDGLFGTDVSGSGSTYLSSISPHSEPVQNGKPRN